MTCNQVIVLLDVRRGFDETRHVGTIAHDLVVLYNAGLIKDGLEWSLTESGEELVNLLLGVAGGRYG